METDLKGKTSERAEVDLVEVLGRLWHCQSLFHPYVAG